LQGTPDEPRGHRPIRVLFLSISFDPEPGAIRGLPLARWLRDRGYEVEVLTAIPWYPLGRFYPGYRFRWAQREEMDGIRVLRVPLFPSHDSSGAKRIATYASFALSAAVLGMPRVRRPDVVYYFDNLPTTGLVAWMIARVSGARVVQHIADLWPDSVTHSGMLRPPALGRLAERFLHRWCNFLYRRHSRITVLSPGFKRVLVERGVEPSRVDVVYNWADESRFAPAAPDPALAERLGLAGKLNVVYGGNMGPLQGLETVVRAADLLRDLPQVQFVFAGSGPREAEVRALAGELRLPNVRFLGRLPLDEMNALNALADALLVHLLDTPAMHATIPSKTQVALASGRPMLMGVRGDAAELVQRAGAGVAFAPEDPEDLARAVRALVALGAPERAEMGRRGREFYEREVSLAVGGEKMDLLFHEVARRVPPRRRPATAGAR
jgi:glycosyltransferase involved in cell wall biosynthesis